MNDIQTLHENRLDTCKEATKKGVLCYHVQSGSRQDDKGEFHPTWNQPIYQFYEGLPPRPNHPEDQWVCKSDFIHESSKDLPGSLLQQDTDLMKGKIFGKISACRCSAREGYWASNTGMHER